MKKNNKANIFFTFILANHLLLSIAMVFVPVKTEWILLVSQLGICFIPLFIYFFITKDNILQTLSLRPISIKTTIFLIIFSVFFQPTLSFFAYIMTAFFDPTVSELIFDIKEAPFLLLFLSIAIFPSFLEEFIFRGVILSNYKNCKPAYAITASALLFAFFHLNLQQFIYTFVAGVTFGYLVYITKSIFSSIICHLIINANSLFSILNVTETVESAFEMSSVYFLIYANIISLPICFLLIKAIKKDNTLHLIKANYNNNITETPFNRLFIINVVVFIILVALIYVDTGL